MGSKEEACAECTRSCISLHRTKLDPYPIVSSFFKVMFGKQFSEELIVPPRFARTITSLVGKRTYLEDSTGQKWDVRLSKVGGSLVFEHGWHEFSLDHGIELGDFVVFHYISGSHFIVQVFTRSGCERPLLFSNLNFQNKRSKAERDSVARGGSDGTSNTDLPPKACSDSCMIAGLDVDSVRRQDTVSKSVPLAEDSPSEGRSRKRPKLAPADDFLFDPYFKSPNFSGEEDREYLFDLSTFENPVKKVDIVETSITEMNICPKLVNESQNAPIGTASVDIQKLEVAETSPLSDEVCLSREESCLLLKSCSDTDMPSRSNMPQNITDLIAPHNPALSEPNCQPPDEAGLERKKSDLLLDSSSDTVIPPCSNVPQNITTPIASVSSAAEANCQPPGEIARIVKNEQKSCQGVSIYGEDPHSRNAHCGSVKVFRHEGLVNNDDHGVSNAEVSPKKGTLEKVMKMKPEPVDFSDSTSPVIIKVVCLVEQDSEPFLELPECLPIRLWRLGAKLDKKLIVLRDPSGRRWPVLYHERKGIYILTNGWKEFKKYNNVQLGDHCTFVLENVEDCIFRVEISRR